MPELSARIAPDLVLFNPVMTASGTFGYLSLIHISEPTRPY